MINQRTIKLIKKYEGFRAKTYLDPVGIPTIGYGTTAKAGVGLSPTFGMIITENEAEFYLRRALDKFHSQIRPLIKMPINENELGAFMSLAYNIGPTQFSRSSALRKFNRGDKQGAADAILLWNKVTVDGEKVPLRGLTKRRAEERKLFLTPPPKQETRFKKWLRRMIGGY